MRSSIETEIDNDSLCNQQETSRGSQRADDSYEKIYILAIYLYILSYLFIYIKLLWYTKKKVRLKCNNSRL